MEGTEGRTFCRFVCWLMIMSEYVWSCPVCQAVRVMVLKAVIVNTASVSRVLLRMRDTGVKVGCTTCSGGRMY